MFPWVVSAPTQCEHFASLIFVFKEIYFSYNMVAKIQANYFVSPTLDDKAA